MLFFKLQLWLFKSIPAQSISIFLKCPLHVFRIHFNKATILILHFFLCLISVTAARQREFCSLYASARQLPTFQLQNI